MKKAVYSVSRNNRYGSNKLTGLGFVTDRDLIIACNGKSGKAYIRVFEDCVKNCHAILSREAFAYVWNKDDDQCSEFGSITVQSFGGGIRRIA